MKIKNLQEIKWSYISKGISLGGGLLILLIIPNYLGSTQYGNFSLILSYISIIEIFFANSINSAVKSNLSHKGFVSESFLIFNEALKLKFILFSIATIIFLLLTPVIPFPLLSKYSFLFLTLLFSMNFWGLIISSFEALHNIFYITLMYIIEYCIKLGGVAFFINFNIITLENIINLFSISYITAFLFGIGILYIKFDRLPLLSQLSLKPDSDKKILKRTFFLTFTGISFVLLSRMDIIMIGAMLEKDITGNYGLASDFAKKATLLSMPIILGVIPSFAKINNIKNLYFHYLKKIFGINLVLAIGIILFAYPFISIVYRDEYLLSAYLLITLSLFPLLSVVQNYTQQILVTLDDTRSIFIASVIAAIVNIILNFIGIYLLGAYGAALATLLTYALWILLNYRRLRAHFSSAGELSYSS